MKIDFYKIFLILIIIVSIIFRIIVIDRIPVGDDKQIDSDMGNPISEEDYENLFNIDNYAEDEHGHFYYIMYIFQNHKLCDDTEGQTYHPPVHYIISAIFLSILDKLPINAIQKIECLQFIGLIYFLISLVIIYKILQEVDLPKESRLFILLLYGFFPKFIQMATLLTNDYLAFIFMMATLLYLIRWSKDDSYKNTIIMALLLGIGIQTKYNVVIMAVPIGIMFLKKIAESYKDNNKILKLIIQIMFFAIISINLSLLYIMRCLIVLGDYKIAVPYDYLYIGDAGLWKNWGINIKDLFIITPECLKNVWFGLLYTSLRFDGRFNYFIWIINILFIFILLYYLFKNIKTNKSLDIKIIIITFISYILSYIGYNIKNPYYCTYDSRYILIVIFLGIVFIGDFYGKLENKAIKRGLLFLLLMFCLCSGITFI